MRMSGKDFYPNAGRATSATTTAASRAKIPRNLSTCWLVQRPFEVVPFWLGRKMALTIGTGQARPAGERLEQGDLINPGEKSLRMVLPA